MPPKKKVPEGELTSAELRKLIRAHNKLTKITIPKGTDREGIIKIIESNGYKVNHPKKRLDAQVKRGKQISLKKADEILPKPKTKEQKAVEKKARDMKKKESTDKIKAEGVKQGAAIQRIIDRKKRDKERKKALKINSKIKNREEMSQKEMSEKQIISLMKNIDKRKMTRARVIEYEENKNDIKEVLSNNDIQGLEQNVDIYDRLVAKYMLRQLKRPSSDKAIREVSDEEDGSVFLDFYNKLYKEWKNDKKEEKAPQKKDDIKSQIKSELIKIIKKYQNEDGGLKKNKYTKEGNNPIANGSSVKITKKGDKFKIITQIKTKELLMDFYNKEIKSIPVLKNNLILSTEIYKDGKKIKPILIPSS